MDSASVLKKYWLFNTYSDLLSMLCWWLVRQEMLSADDAATSESQLVVSRCKQVEYLQQQVLDLNLHKQLHGANVNLADPHGSLHRCQCLCFRRTYITSTITVIIICWTSRTLLRRNPSRLLGISCRKYQHSVGHWLSLISLMSVANCHWQRASFDDVKPICFRGLVFFSETRCS